MLHRFTLAAVVAATTLTGCAALKPAPTTASVSEAKQSTDAPVAAVQPAQAEQAVQPVQTQPITAPGAITESAPAVDPADSSAASATAETAVEAPAETVATSAPAVADSAAAPAEPVKEEKISAAEGTQAIAPFSSGPTQIDVSHIVTRADDGSSITLTIDGTEAGILKRGEKRAVFVEPGKHKVGGYVQTLFGLGRVTIPAVEITTVPGKVKKVAYSVTKTKPAFAETPADSSNSAG